MKRDLSRIPDPKAPGFTWRDERSTPVAREFIEARRARDRKQVPASIDEPIPYVLTDMAIAILDAHKDD